MNKQQVVLDYIKTQILGVLATVNNKRNPEAALIAISETENFELVFGTYETTRKYINIKRNPNVAIVFGHNVEEGITVQIEGVATEVMGKEIDPYREIHIKKNPPSEKYAYKPEQRWFKVIPRWVRYTSLSVNPQIEFELFITENGLTVQKEQEILKASEEADKGINVSKYMSVDELLEDLK